MVERIDRGNGQTEVIERIDRQNGVRECTMSRDDFERFLATRFHPAARQEARQSLESTGEWVTAGYVYTRK